MLSQRFGDEDRHLEFLLVKSKLLKEIVLGAERGNGRGKPDPAFAKIFGSSPI